ncbi:hypothetical protein [Mechercharimyces sp. CAU 1602]|uniref:hypothetical protein n=1 Tax=Mechercharimyces sp. CAU 1602 TaxID=2973933 RepID=UPI00216132FE|nr:hypothetical protein [Mechercharimyces sp. CAU 1602]MCS1351698.1 hypothetical protein [Mechercharimyces sp. CAU 1602]
MLKIADVKTQKKESGHQNEDLAGSELADDGQMVLEVPVHKGSIPKEILDYATDRNILIRDE